MRSTDVDQVLSIMTRMFLWLSVTKTMTFGRSNTLSHILIWCLIGFDEINNLCDFLDFVEKLWIHPQTRKIMILSQVITYPMRMFDMALKCSKYIILIFKRAWRGFCTFKITTTNYHYLLLTTTSTTTTTTTTTRVLLPPPLPNTDYHHISLLLPLPPPLPPLPTTDFHHHHHYYHPTTTSALKVVRGFCTFKITTTAFNTATTTNYVWWWCHHHDHQFLM